MGEIILESYTKQPWTTYSIFFIFFEKPYTHTLLDHREENLFRFMSGQSCLIFFLFLFLVRYDLRFDVWMKVYILELNEMTNQTPNSLSLSLSNRRQVFINKQDLKITTTTTTTDLLWITHNNNNTINSVESSDVSTTTTKKNMNRM